MREIGPFVEHLRKHIDVLVSGAAIQHLIADDKACEIERRLRICGYLQRLQLALAATMKRLSEAVHATH
jgi:hypothetical protein